MTALKGLDFAVLSLLPSQGVSVFLFGAKDFAEVWSIHVLKNRSSFDFTKRSEFCIITHNPLQNSATVLTL